MGIFICLYFISPNECHGRWHRAISGSTTLLVPDVWALAFDEATQSTANSQW